MIGQAGIFGINNSGLALAVVIVIVVLVALWLALIYWTFADARRRIDDSMLVACATVLALVPFLGPLIYLIVRPPEYLDDVRERELEIQAAEVRLQGLDHHSCPYCGSPIEKDFLRCPSCLRKLKEPCVNCGRPLDPAWQICPYCEQAVAPRASKSQRRRRRSSTQERPVERGDDARSGTQQPRAEQRTGDFPRNGQGQRPPGDRGGDGENRPRAGSRPARSPSDSDLI